VARMAFIGFMTSCSNNVYVPEYLSPSYLPLAGFIAANFIQQMFNKYNIYNNNY
jgi:hypothetical protein